MLTSLQIKDYALIENLTVRFKKGLNIITGETGAGKSILIDSLGLLLGERASTEVVRKGSAKSVVEGIFEAEGNSKLRKLLEENEIEVMPELIVRREISLKGSNRCFINDTPVPLSFVKEIGDLLIDLHGQHEHQSLLKSDLHIHMLDETGSYGGLIEKFNRERRELKEKLKELNSLIQKEKELAEKRDLYEFQIREIDSVSPVEGEEKNLNEELNILENSERLLGLSTEVFEGLYEGHDTIYDRLVAIQNKLNELVIIDKTFREKEEECNSALAVVEDISNFVRSYRDNIELEPARLEEVRERLSAIYLLKKKYGGSLEAVIEHRKKIGEEFDLADNFAGRIKDLNQEADKLRKKAGATAAEITEARIKKAAEIKPLIEEELKYLGIQDSSFEVRLTGEKFDGAGEDYVISGGKKLRYNSAGADIVEFYITTNAGEDPKPLAKVASGGEVSRIMLALKSVLAKNDKLPLLVFDEIDTGVSGRVARKVGEALRALSEHHQIIAITHLPQIAGLGSSHYAVEKSKSDGRVVSFIRELNNEERVREVAKLMSGDELTEAGLQGARELLGVKG